MSEEKQTKYPAGFIIHWPTGPVNACLIHANGIVKLGKFMGSHIAVTFGDMWEDECFNCKNEAENRQC